MELDEYKYEKHERLSESENTDEQLQSYIKIWEQIIYFPNLYTQIEPYLNLNRPIKDAAEEFNKGKTLELGLNVKDLHAKIGQLSMENDFLSNALGRIDGASAKR